MASAAYLLDPQNSIRAASPVDARMRGLYLALDTGVVPSRPKSTSGADPEPATWLRWGGHVVMNSARFLEFVLVSAITWELLVELGLESVDALGLENVRREVFL